jgi:hypothetical protein
MLWPDTSRALGYVAAVGTTRRRVSIRVAGIVLVLVGAALTLAAIGGLTWYAVDDGADSAGAGFTFADLHTNADQLGAPIAAAYFDWLAWVLLIGLVVVGIAANVSSPATNGLRVLGFLLGVIGVGGTYYALAQLFNAQRAAGGSNHSVWPNSTLGVWCALIGYLLAGTGAGLGARPGVLHKGGSGHSDTIAR